MDISDESGTLKENLKLPEGEDDIELVNEVKNGFAADKDLLLSVISACGLEKVVGCRENNK